MATRDEVLAATTDPDTCLINALSPEQHSGRVPVANGRIESSVNVPAVSLIDPSTGAFLSLEQLRAAFEKVGATRPAALSHTAQPGSMPQAMPSY